MQVVKISGVVPVEQRPRVKPVGVYNERPVLEFKPSGKLHDARRECRCQPSEIRAVNVEDATVIRNEEVRSIEHVERFSAEFQSHRLAKSNSLHEPGIPIKVEGTVQEGSGKIPGFTRSVPEEHLTRKCGLVDCRRATDFAKRESRRKRLVEVDTSSRFDNRSCRIATHRRREQHTWIDKEYTVRRLVDADQVLNLIRR